MQYKQVFSYTYNASSKGRIFGPFWSENTLPILVYMYRFNSKWIRMKHKNVWIRNAFEEFMFSFTL